MKKFKRLLFLILFLGLTIPAYCFRFSPMNFDKRIDGDDSYQEFTIKNDSKKNIKYQIRVFSTGKENDVSKFVKIYPKVISVDPLSEGKFKVFLENDESIKNGEHGFMIGIKSIKMPELNDTKPTVADPALEFKIGVNLEMFAYKGDVKEEFTLTNNKFYKDKEGKKYWQGTIKNDTGRGYELAVGFKDRMEAVFGLESKGRLFNGKTADLKVQIPKGAKKIIFWDWNNNSVVCQEIEI